MTAVAFTLVEEATKMLNIVRNDRSEIRTKSDKADFEKLPYEQHEAGFFIVYMKKVGSGVKATNKKRADRLMSQLTTSQHNGMVMMSTFCTFDRVYKLMNDCCAVFDTALVGFSTPTNLQILAENPANY